MDKREITLGIGIAVAATLLASFISFIVVQYAVGQAAIVEDEIIEVIEENRVLSAEEADEMQESIQRIDATLESSLDVQRQLLDAILDRG